MIYLITGPTSSGKTKYAIKLAKRLKGEIISADSRQVYKGMHIGTGAPILYRGAYKGIKHHLIGIANPTKPYTVYDFQKNALRLINGIQKRGKIPIIAGGTGLWIRALKEDLDFAEIKPDTTLRKRLEKELKGKGLQYLVEKLKKLQNNHCPEFDSGPRNPDAGFGSGLQSKRRSKKQKDLNSFALLDSRSNPGMTDFDYKNPRRVIRVLEIALSKKPARLPKRSPTHALTFKTIHLSPPKDVLLNRINKRVDQMIKDGLVKEVKLLIKKYASNKHGIVNYSKLKKYPALTGIGYREIVDYLQGKTTLLKAVELIKIHTRQYAKRQITWFKKY